ncbi:MAG: response regulator transcription factor [Phycisphaerales bacterium JB038]
MHLLLVEDSIRLQESLGVGLRRSGYAVDIAGDGEQGLRYARHNPYDVVILDLMLPRMDGLTVLRHLREEGNQAHVLILTARSEVEDRVEGLRQGADDYLGKPFSFDELLARIEALVRRRYQEKSPTVRIGPLTFDAANKTVTRAGATVELSRREYALFEYLVYRKGDVVSRLQIEDHLYSERDFPMSNAVDRLVCSLRKKIEQPGSAPLLRTRRGLGYVLDDPSP